MNVRALLLLGLSACATAPRAVHEVGEESGRGTLAFLDVRVFDGEQVLPCP